MDECDNSRTGRNKGSFSEQPNPDRAEHRQTYAIIHRGNPSSCKRDARRRTRNGRTQIPPSKVGLLCVHYPYSVQVTVPALSKDSVRGIYGIPEAATLLSRVFDNGSLGSTT